MPPQLSLQHSPEANASVIAPRFSATVDTRLPLPTTGIALPVTAVRITLVFQLRLMGTSLYGLNSSPAGAGGGEGCGEGAGAGEGAGGGGAVPQDPCAVHGWPEPEPPLLLAGPLFWVHQLAL